MADSPAMREAKAKRSQAAWDKETARRQPILNRMPSPKPKPDPTKMNAYSRILHYLKNPE